MIKEKDLQLHGTKPTYDSCDCSARAVKGMVPGFDVQMLTVLIA